jgi:signal transduction histidine kinase
VGLAEANAVSTQRLEETRAVFRGVARTLRKPLHELAEAAMAAGSTEQKEAGAEAAFFLATLESLAGPVSAPLGPLSAMAAARSAVAQAGVRFPASVFEVQGDGEGRFLCRSEEVVQAICLLLENAVEAVNRPGSTVRVQCARDFGRAVIEVIDGGPGLGTLARRRMFRPFWTTKPGHRGLGLYMARQLIERNEGGVLVSDSPSGGAVARVAFPLFAEDA